MDATPFLSSSFRPVEKRWNWRSLYTLSLSQRVPCGIGGIGRTPAHLRISRHAVACNVMYWQRESGKRHGRARGLMETKSHRSRWGAVRNADYSNIFTVFSVSRITGSGRSLYSWFSSIRLDLYTSCVPEPALSHFVYNFMAQGDPEPRLRS